jgi:SAM-dependent methyltransferase
MPACPAHSRPMKSRIIPALALIFALRISAETIDLYLVAGQSNAVGFDADPAKLPEEAGDKEVMLWWRCGDPPPDEHDTMSRGWTYLKPQPLGDPIKPRKDRQYGNFGQAAGGFGPEIGFAREMRRQGAGKIAIVKAAFSGTGIRRDWNPRSDGADGSCYRALLEEVTKATAEARTQGAELRLRALLWVQGESDANARDAEHYEKALAAMLAALRKDLDAPGMVSLLAVNTRFLEGRNKFMPQIVEAQRAVAKADPLAVYVDTAKCSIANQVHFDAAGTLEMGRLFAMAFADMDSKSVKPGINEQFLDPGLKVTQWVERFEKEGREVYDHRREIVAAAKVGRGAVVADIGAGTGLFVPLWAEAVGDQGKVIAVDIVPKFLSHIAGRAKEQGMSHVETQLCTGRSTGLKADSIDVAFICDTYHHFEHPQDTLASLHQALRARGEILLVDFKREEGVSSEWILSHVRAGEAVFAKEIEEAGFELAERMDLLKDNYVLRFKKR